MAKAFVRVCVEVGKERGVRDGLRLFDEVEMAEMTSGEQDVIAIVHGSSFEDILTFVQSRLRQFTGIKVTWTNFILET
ncbi:MAG TPA: Lrp/AsnC ligand binding domain-containing protein [Thermoanaerobaculia bacterium]|nr:Lrp/AsnC ligand binding domain-containing protein [Thermoanaerobaculia bacterium]HUM31088.1 Lrp/AsnC ligand binding domain-containing protein [Thermoanaerobaculia bacterium]HXK69400.1 Lrp/AsnC ligand binding domain-containing protein [Thermoanaerobaculia bacterium]